MLNSLVRIWPYPHVIIDGWLPWKLYDRLCDEWPSDKFRPIDEIRPTAGYPDRSALHETEENTPTSGPWAELFEATHSDNFRNSWMQRFKPWLKQRYGDGLLQIAPDTLLCEDKGGYELGPHSDTFQKVMSLVAYFPSLACPGPSSIGTSILSASGFTCAGGPHYPVDDPRFTEVYRTAYKPNSMFCLLKTEKSFHGVKQLPDGTHRRVYIWNLRGKFDDATFEKIQLEKV